ncbi:MAG: hypothetical protein ABR968_02535 [Bacteroidales bacterium]
MRNPLIILCFLLSLFLASCQRKINSRRNSFSGQKKEVIDNQNRIYQRKAAKDKGIYKLNTRKNNRNPFSNYSKHNRSTSSIRKENQSTGSYEYSEKQRKVVGKKYLIFWNKKDKRDRVSSDIRTDTRENIGSYEYNLKKKKVVKKKFLFFKRYKREKETSTFSGGKHIFRFRASKGNNRAKTHKHGLFRRHMEKNHKNKKLSPELFDPSMRIII